MTELENSACDSLAGNYVLILIRPWLTANQNIDMKSDLLGQWFFFLLVKGTRLRVLEVFW